MKFLIQVIVTLAVIQNIHGKIFSKCELVKKLSGTFPRNQLPDWNCLVKAESTYNSRAKGPRNADGSYDWGIFQINDRYWCKVGRAGGDCNIDCNKLIDDDITDDIRCAQKVYNRHTFEAWNGWKANCKGKPLQSVNECL